MAAISGLGSLTLTTPVLAGGVNNASITTTTARPYSLATMDVDTALTYDALNKKLQLESVLDSVFVDLGTDVAFEGVNKKVMVPDACIMKLTGEAGATSQILTLENPLAGPGRGGDSEDQRGFERNVTLEYMQVYYNEYSQGVMGEKWGKNFNQLDVFKYYANEQPRLSRWFAEDLDRQYHEALLEKYSWVLADKNPTSGTCVQMLNPNWFIANLDPASQPSYASGASGSGSGAGSYLLSVSTALQAADTGTNGVNANIDLDYLIYLDSYARTNKRIKPVTIGGKQSYVVLLPSAQYYKLLRITNGQLGSLWQSVASLSSEEQRFPGIVGRVMSLVIVEDTRYPTIEFTDGYATGANTIEYVLPGNSDSRNKAVYDSSSNAAWDIGFLLGAGAIVDWTAKPLHFEMEEDEYGKRYGKAAFTERGIQLGCTYDLDTKSMATKNFGSIALAFTAASLSVVA